MKVARGRTREGELVWAAVNDEPADGPVYYRLDGPPFHGRQIPGAEVRFVSLLAPIEPRAIFCIGLNYRAHAVAMGQPEPKFPVIIPKGINAVQHPGEPIVLPRHLASSKVDYEGELAVIIGRDCKNVSRDEAFDYVFGYTCANDVSARDWQFEFGGGQWARSKQFDTFAPLGPWLVTSDEIPDPSRLQLTTRLNGAVMQHAMTSLMIFDIPCLIEFLSASTTLLAGTVLLTGTPAGTGMKQDPPRWLRPGDRVEVEIESIGTLSNPVGEEVVPGSKTA